MKPWTFALAAAAVLAQACGGDRVANPPRPPAPSTAPTGLASGTVLDVVAASTGAPVAGASVTIGGQAYVSDGSGRLTLTTPAQPGALVDVTAAGFLDRQTLVRTRPSPRLALWPRTTASGIDEAFTTAIVYTSAALDNGAPGALPLRRLPVGATQVVVVPSAEILDDARAHDFQVQGVARMIAADRGAVVYALARERPASGIVFDALIRPSEPMCVANTARAFVRLSLRASEINGGEIVYCGLDIARSATVVHELGHTFGLEHSNDPRELMFGGFSRSRREDFGARESEVMALLLERPAGNRFPDSDRDVSGLSNRLDVVVIACP